MFTVFFFFIFSYCRHCAADWLWILRCQLHWIWSENCLQLSHRFVCGLVSICLCVKQNSCALNSQNCMICILSYLQTGFPFDASKMPPDDVVQKFLKDYLSKRHEFEKIPGEVKTEELEKLKKETYNCFVVCFPNGFLPFLFGIDLVNCLWLQSLFLFQLGLLLTAIFLPTLEKRNIRDGTEVNFTRYCSFDSSFSLEKWKRVKHTDLWCFTIWTVKWFWPREVSRPCMQCWHKLTKNFHQSGILLT